MNTAPLASETAGRAQPGSRYFDVVAVAFVSVYLISQVSSSKLFAVGRVQLPGAAVVFPLSYIFGDILTEVYGYARDRRCVWAGFGALVFAAIVAATIVALPPADWWATKQPAVETIFGNTPRIVAASIIAFWCGSFVNSYVLAKMKIWTDGRWLWTRTVGSTLCGELVDSALFYVIAFWGLWSTDQLIQVTATQYVLKSGWEIIATPLTYKVVGFLKRAEQEDFYDRQTNFTPFSLEA